jgi:hypothetical protein
MKKDANAKAGCYKHTKGLLFNDANSKCLECFPNYLLKTDGTCEKLAAKPFLEDLTAITNCPY